eukprot:2084415-Lingulodinium_polyedra.AAC.1
MHGARQPVRVWDHITRPNNSTHGRANRSCNAHAALNAGASPAKCFRVTAQSTTRDRGVATRSAMKRAYIPGPNR